jgi:hypothetical protein
VPRFRWPRFSNVPAELREQLEAEGLLFMAASVGVNRSFSGHVPGVYSAAGVARYRGMFAFSAARIVATFPTGASPNLRSIDCPWDTDPGPATATISSHGLGVEINLREVDHAFSGTMKLNYKRDIPDEVLQQLPTTTVKYRLEPMFVYRAAGVRPRV